MKLSPHLHNAKLLIVITIVVLMSASAYFFFPQQSRQYSFPGNKKFALAIVDDTDYATLQNVLPVYRFLRDKGVISTKTVWSLPADKKEHGYTPGDTITSLPYQRFILSLKNEGFEIASHGSRGASSNRQQTIEGLNKFKNVVGSFPRIHINHRFNKDNLYWGEQRMSFGPLRWMYRQAKASEAYLGEVPGSEYYWGDIAQTSIVYSRDFSFHRLNLATLGAAYPRRLNDKPLINKWFYTSNGDDVNAFNRLLSQQNLNEIEEAGGYSIIYTHFGKDFYRHGQLNPEFVARIEDLVSRDVWITTASELLDFLDANNPDENAPIEEFRLQLIWSLEQVFFD